MLTPEQIATEMLSDLNDRYPNGIPDDWDSLHELIATAVKAGRGQHTEPVRNYEVGDFDTTLPDRPWCDAEHPARAFVCTRIPGHRGDHAAGDGLDIVAVWGSER